MKSRTCKTKRGWNQKERSCWNIPIPIKQREMENKEGEDGLPQNPNPNPNQTRGSTKGRSCKGCLYYSSVQKSKSKYPTCVGFYRTLNQGLSLSLTSSKLISFSSKWLILLCVMMLCFWNSIESNASSELTLISAIWMWLIHERWKLLLMPVPLYCSNIYLAHLVF